MLQLIYISFEASSRDYLSIYKHDLHTSLLLFPPQQDL